MELFPIGLALFTIFLVIRIRSPKTGFNAAMAMIPFGALAIVTLGNFNLLLFHAVFAVLLGLTYSRHLIMRERHLVPKLEMTASLLVVLTIYAVVSSQLLPRIFEGDVLVFSLDSGALGQRVSPYFLTRVSPLRLSSGNISQPVYFVLSTLVFLMALRLGRKHGVGFLDRGLYYTAGVNAFIGLIDFVGGDAFLLLFKTAGYSIIADARVGSLLRMTGAFPEASVMGAFSATLFGYMFMRYLDTGSRSALALAGLNFAWGAFALSSTGFVALASAGLFIVFRSGLSNISNRIPRIQGLRMYVFALVSLSVALLVLVFTPLGGAVWDYVDLLIFQKGTTVSALERGAWARRGLQLGFETYGLGAGLGSTLSNGYLAVLISNVGFIGLTLFALFLYNVARAPEAEFTSAKDIRFFNAAFVGLMTNLSANLVSGTTADPGIVFVILCAMAVAARPPRYFLRARRQQRNQH